MKLKRWLLELLVLVGLFCVGGIYSHPIYAMPSINTLRGMQYWFKTRHVRAKYGFRVYEIHDEDPEADSYVVTSKYIRKGTPLYVNYRGIEWDWTLNNHYFNGRKIGYYVGHNYWIAGGESSRWMPYHYHKHVYHPGAKYVKARFKQTNSKRVAAKSGYGEYEKLINKKTNAWYESIHNYYNPDNRKARIRASWDFYPKDHIYWTNTRTGTTYKHLRKNIWVKVN